MKRISKIYEEIREKDRIQIPVNVKLNKKYKKSINSLVSSIDTYNNTKDTDTLKYSLTQSLRLIDEILEDNIIEDLLLGYQSLKYIPSNSVAFIYKNLINMVY